ncbi:hypothetical protein QJS04_geneDACA001621 [Acorus gramineus]|uniref:Transcriptional regulator of RNA polII, SAGA, subunit n=1 Tax=Acorus gramineus TaxID=55184 RepID=A0AAV9BEK8_ACOGR|nr:hypothetical protein QJS04_geneDACA001621 [Acorus gramineus]
MSSSSRSSRVDTLELKLHIIKKLGREKAEKYFTYLTRFLSFRINKREFDKLCFSTIGRENFALHNSFVRSILTNASVAQTPPSREPSKQSRILNGQWRDVIPPSPRRCRSANARKYRDRSSPLGPDSQLTKSCVIQRPNETELVSVGSKAFIGSVEDGEEVEQEAWSPTIQSRSPLRPPFGIVMGSNASKKTIRKSAPLVRETCLNSSILPDANMLKERLERRLEAEGVGVSTDYVNVLCGGLDAFLKRLIRPCMEVARGHQHDLQRRDFGQSPRREFLASLLDFQVAMQLNPQLLGEDWPTHLEKISSRAWEGQ